MSRRQSDSGVSRTIATEGGKERLDIVLKVEKTRNIVGGEGGKLVTQK